MSDSIRRVARAWSPLLAALMAASGTGCDGGGEAVVEYSGGAEVVIARDCCDETYDYIVEVLVAFEGWVVPGAEVELIVAAVPERRYVGYTDGYGVAVFAIEAPADVTIIAYACAPGYGCGAGDVGTLAELYHLGIAVDLAF